MIGRYAGAVIAAVLFSSAASAEVISGAARVIDGDMVAVNGVNIRLEGIDAPEKDQPCLDGGKEWMCGIAARDYLADVLKDKQVSCLAAKRDKYGRALATCYSEGKDLNALMVRNGYALAYVEYSGKYIPDGVAAKIARKGIWKGDFVSPWYWRRYKRGD